MGITLRAISKTCRQRSDLSSRSAHRVAQRTPSTHTRRCATHDATFKTRLDCAPSGEFARLQGHVTANRPLKMTTQSVNSRASGAGMGTYLDQAMRGAQGMCCSQSIRWVLAHVCARFRTHMSSARSQGDHPSPRQILAKHSFPPPILTKIGGGNKISLTKRVTTDRHTRKPY